MKVSPVCVDCGVNTFARETRSVYMVQFPLWRKYGAGKSMLCMSCFEKRLGRKLTKDDFTNCKLNKDQGLLGDPRMENNLKKLDISAEASRTYSIPILDQEGKIICTREYEIKDPVFLFLKTGGSTHRVQDITGKVHCVPAPGCTGTTFTWIPKDMQNPVQF